LTTSLSTPVRERERLTTEATEFTEVRESKTGVNVKI